MGKIIGISGRKQSGKNTSANYIHGHVLKSKGFVQDFFLNDNGELVIQTTDHNGKLGYGVLDITRKDKPFIEYAEKELWPYIKIYSFADILKEICITVFGLTHQQVYGLDEHKNSKIDILWQNIPYNKNRKGQMTAREFLQHFGTNVVRKMKDNAWVDCTIKKILKEDSELAIISDVRFPNEVQAIKENGGIVIRMTRDVYKDAHVCESVLDKSNYDWTNFDFIINNDTSSIPELCHNLETINHIWT